MPGEPSPSAASLPFRRIVVAVDASESAKHALAWGRALATHPDTQVWILHAAASPSLIMQTGGGLAGPVPVADLVRYEEERGRLLLEEARREFGDIPGHVETVLREGPPTMVLADFVREVRADFAIVGSEGRGPLGRLLLGSVADAARHRIDTDLLVARTDPPLDRIVAAVDDSPLSAQAALHALEFGRAFGVPVDLLHVLPAAYRGIPEEERRALTETLRDVQPALADPSVSLTVDFGDAAEVIVAHAEARGCDLIAMGCRGRSALGELVLGSVSREVSHRAHVSVLIAKEPAH
ncbi:MAG TPA: universal stress protein [Candidatus Thermoplasmatota archaeon]|nr:universal stress protein [Candidatus Thermoplasmatota archaeon]